MNKVILRKIIQFILKISFNVKYDTSSINLTAPAKMRSLYHLFPNMLLATREKQVFYSFKITQFLCNCTFLTFYNVNKL